MPTLELHGHAPAYEVHGPREGESERAVVLLHNLLCDRSVFDPHVARLARRCRVVTLDFRAHGARRGAMTPFGIPDLSRDLLAVLDAAGIGRATLVGVSLGASVAMELALARPERVAGLVLMAATAGVATPRDRVENGGLTLAVRLLGLRPFLVRKALAILFGKSFRAERPAAVAARGGRIAAMGVADVLLAARAWLRRPLLLPRLPAIRARTLVVAGDEDVACPPAHGEAIAAAIPGARLVRLPRAGHAITVERPEETAALIEEFLDLT